jgi:hypothetical protein
MVQKGLMVALDTLLSEILDVTPVEEKMSGDCSISVDVEQQTRHSSSDNLL